MATNENFYIWSKQGITVNSTESCLLLGLIPGNGTYLICMMTNTTNDAASIYMLRYFHNGTIGTYYVCPIFEGAAATAPRITSTGVVKLNTSTTSTTTIRCGVIRIP